jgi:hypothetical protein
MVDQEIESRERFGPMITFDHGGKKVVGHLLHRTDYHEDESKTETYAIMLDRLSYKYLMDVIKETEER